MAEYGDTDPGRFTEDGSFIGKINNCRLIYRFVADFHIGIKIKNFLQGNMCRTKH